MPQPAERLSAPGLRAPHPAAGPALAAIGRAATLALHDELALHPKPGLVSYVDTGSHQDMDAGTFLRSLFALRHAYPRLASLGFEGAGWAALQACGIQAERRMLAATGGINTHRGAIFNLGLLCAAAGWRLAQGLALTPAGLRHTLQTVWGPALADRARLTPPSHGGAAVRAHGLRGANEEAAAGMPVLFDVAWPALQQALAAGWGWDAARAQCLLAVMAVLDDTNLAHRGGLIGLREAQAMSQAFLADGGMGQNDAWARLAALHSHFVARRWSPGGAADLLAAACWLQRVCAGGPPR